MTIQKLFGESWAKQIESLPNFSNNLNNIADFLKEERAKGKQIIPEYNSDLWFKSFRSTPFEDVKVVILGQDPYHTPGAFDGLAFSNSTLYRPQPSLRNILQEVVNDVYNGVNEERLHNYSLYNWAKQGVLLLNTAHSVEVGKAGSHLSKWNQFTNDIINLLNKKKYIVWILWGSKARQIKSMVAVQHSIIESSHPSPLSARHGFYDSAPFSKCNQLLETPIIW
jgi:uracil-DNA glycosylase